MASSLASDKIVQMDPAVLLVGDNTRFSLKPSRVEALAADIVSFGGVHTPIEVEPLGEPVNGKTHRVTVGHYRHAAVAHLNSTAAAGLTLPAFVRSTGGDAVVRMRRQLSENVQRESLSPMDQAIAIKRLLDAGVPRIDIRTIFARPGGRKGNTVQPVSNSFLNMTMSFLTLPKSMQEKIHDGRIGVAAAYELVKVAPEKRQDVLDRAEAERLKAVEADEKDEEKYLKAEAKVTEAEQKAAAAAQTFNETKAAVTLAKEQEKEAAKAIAAFKTPANFLSLSKEEQKKIGEQKAALEANQKAAVKLIDEATKKLAKLEGTATKATETATAAKERLAAARKSATAPAASKAKVTADDVKAASKAEGATNGAVALNASQMRALVAGLQTTAYPTVSAIAEALTSAFAGVLTEKQLLRKLAELVQEPNLPKPAPAKAAAKKA